MSITKTFTAVSILIGTIIGAGVLGIPYVVMRSGFSIGVFHLILVFIIMTITMLYLGEIGLRTKKNHQLTGYASLYLGKKGKLIMIIAFAFGIYSAMVAYLIGEGESLSHIFFNNASYTLHFGIAFWLFLSFLNYFGMKALESGEKYGISLIIILIISIVIFTWNKIDVSNLTYTNPSNFFIPFGVIVFAYLGFSAVPQLERALNKHKKLTKSSIIIANILVLIIYTIFAAVVLGFKGSSTPEIATIALGKIFIILGMLTIFTSHLALSIALIETLRYDYYINKNKAWLITIIPPLIAFILLEFLNIGSFTKVLGIGGIISGGLEAILILLMVKHAKTKGQRRPEYSIPYHSIIIWILAILFIIGAVFEIMNTI